MNSKTSIASCSPQMKHVPQTKGEMITMKSENTQKASKLVVPPPTPNGKDELAPFLKAVDISMNETTEITLLGDGRKSSSRYGEGLDVACRIGNKNYTLTIKYDPLNHRRLFKRFGVEIEKWKGIVKVERKKHKGNEYVA